VGAKNDMLDGDGTGPRDKEAVKEYRQIDVIVPAHGNGRDMTNGRYLW
jgi:hypothetical protein